MTLRHHIILFPPHNIFQLPTVPSHYVIHCPSTFISSQLIYFRVSRSITLLSHATKAQLHVTRTQLHHQQTASNSSNLAALHIPPPHLVPPSHSSFCSCFSWPLPHISIFQPQCFPVLPQRSSHNVSLVPHIQRSLAKMTSSKVNPLQLCDPLCPITPKFATSIRIPFFWSPLHFQAVTVGAYAL